MSLACSTQWKFNSSVFKLLHLPYRGPKVYFSLSTVFTICIEILIFRISNNWQLRAKFSPSPALLKSQFWLSACAHWVRFLSWVWFQAYAKKFHDERKSDSSRRSAVGPTVLRKLIELRMLCRKKWEGKNSSSSQGFY